MDELRAYILRVAVAAVSGAIVMTLAPSGKGQQRILKMVCGLFLLLVLCAPLDGLGISLETDSLTEIKQGAAEVEARTRKEVKREMASVISQKIQAYIEDKAAELGTELYAEVTLDEGGTPWSVELRGTAAPYVKTKLSEQIAEQLGIPKERQVWRT